MTHAAAGPQRGVPRSWVLPVLALLLIAGATLLEWLSSSIVYDFLAWWPVWLFLIFVGLLARQRRWGRLRVSALVPILTVIALAAFVAGHIRGWPVMPSASTDLNGPQAGSVATAALSARIDGELRVGSGESGFLYAVDPVRRGGDIGPPVATEQIQGANLSVVLQPSPDPGLYLYAGWIIDLDEGPEWSISLEGEVDADLSRLRLASLQLGGEGEAILGAAPGEVVLTVSGAYEVSVPSDAPARVVGEAVVPPAWTQTADGFQGPAPGPGWVISVGEGSSLTITDH